MKKGTLICKRNSHLIPSLVEFIRIKNHNSGGVIVTVKNDFGHEWHVYLTSKASFYRFYKKATSKDIEHYLNFMLRANIIKIYRAKLLKFMESI